MACDVLTGREAAGGRGVVSAGCRGTSIANASVAEALHKVVPVGAGCIGIHALRALRWGVGGHVAWEAHVPAMVWGLQPHTQACAQRSIIPTD